MFPDYHEFETLPLNVKSEILDSISRIGLSETEDPQRKAEACFAVAMLYLERLGTVRPVAPDSEEYSGVEIDGVEVMYWLRCAADMGSPSAQAAYYSILQALKMHMKTQGRDSSASRPNPFTIGKHSNCFVTNPFSAAL